MPGYTETDIANLALGHIGDARISDLSDANDSRAEILNDNYDHAVAFVFATHEWHWARRDAELAQLPDAPATRYAYQFTLPPSFVRVANVSDNATMYPTSDDWAVKNGNFCTNDAAVFMEYVASDWDESQWPAYFAEAVSVKLAALSAPRISHNMSARADLEDKFDKVAMVKARVTDSQGQPPRQRIIRSEWRRDRFARGFPRTYRLGTSE
jgi:hypothetical protein